MTHPTGQATKTLPTDTRDHSEPILKRHRAALFPSVKPSYADPVVMASAEGVWVTDVDGAEYLDLFAGILSTSVGHCHPKVVSRVQEQAARLGHTSTLYVNEAQVEAGERLAAVAPGQLSQTFFTNSGTEAVETALSLAGVVTGRTEVVALRYSYHGRSTLASNVTANAAWRPMAAAIPGIVHARSPYRYRCEHPDADDATLAEYFANDLDEVIRTSTSGRPAAFIAETIQGVAGYVVPPQGYFQRVAEIIRSYGGLLIIDEVQAGFGRTGGKWFGIEHWGVEPDILVTAKGIANGFPAAATTTRPEIAEAWSGKTISTFGGNPVSMAAVAATLEVMVEEDVPTRARVRGQELVAGLTALADAYPWIGEVRGMGLMQGIEIVKDPDTRTPDPARAAAVFEAARAEGLLVGLGGHWDQVVRIGPSLLITADEIAEGLTRLGRACARANV